MKFKKQFLEDLIYGSCEEHIAEKITDDIIDHGRWDVTHRVIFKTGGKFYELVYAVGATEQQDYDPFESAPDLMECTEVEPKERTVTIYVEKD